MSAIDWLTLRLRLADQAAFNAGLAGASGSVTRFGDATEVAGKKSAFAAEKTFLFGESMYSLRRYAFYALTAVGVTAAGVLKLGYEFDKAKQEGIDALTGITHNSVLARQEITALVGLTHSSGLKLTDLVTGAKNMLTFGYSIRETNQYLKAFAVYSQVTGRGAGGVASLVSLFSVMKDTGRMTARQIKGLEGLGIPFSQLGALLGISGLQQQLAERGQVQVNAAVAEPAIARWLNSYSAGQRKPLSMQFGILKSYASQFMGALDKPFFNWLQDRALPGLTGIFKKAVDGYGRGGMKGMFSAIDPSGTLTNAWVVFATAVRELGQVLGVTWKIIKAFGIVLIPVALILGPLAKNTTLVKGAVIGLTAAYVLNKAVLISEIFWTKAAYAAAWLWVNAEKATATATIAWTSVTATQTTALVGLTTELNAAKFAAYGLLGVLGLVAAAAGIAYAGKDFASGAAGKSKATGTILGHLANVQTGGFQTVRVNGYTSVSRDPKTGAFSKNTELGGLSRTEAISNAVAAKLLDVTQAILDREFHITVPVVVDGKTIAEAAAHGKADAAARR